MKHLAVVVVLLAGFVAAAPAQDWGDPQLLQRAGLSEQEIAEIMRIFEDTEQAIREARLEVEVLRAQLRRLLFEEKVDMGEVERLIRAGLEWELKERMAQIRRQVELRRILGDRRFARLAEQVRARERERQEREGQERERRERSADGSSSGGAQKGRP